MTIVLHQGHIVNMGVESGETVGSKSATKRGDKEGYWRVSLTKFTDVKILFKEIVYRHPKVQNLTGAFLADRLVYSI